MRAIPVLSTRSQALRLGILLILIVTMVLTSVSPASAAGSSSTKVWVGSPLQGQYAGTNGRPASSLPGRHAPVFTVPGYSYKHDVAWDLYAPAGTAVRVYVAPKTSASVTTKVLNVKPASASGTVSYGGYVVFVGVYHEGVRVGDVAYAHVNPDFNQDGVTNSTDLNFRGSLSRWGGYVGKVGKYTKNSCWDVSTTAGHHVHIELSNVKNYACYRSLGAGSTVKAGEYVGYLGGAFATKREQGVSSWRLIDVTVPKPVATESGKRASSPRASASRVKVSDTANPLRCESD